MSERPYIETDRCAHEANHITTDQGEVVLLYNNDDSYYTQVFWNWGELRRFIATLEAEAEKAWGKEP